MTTEVGARLSPEQMEIRARAKAAVEALTQHMEPSPRTWAAQAAGAREVVVAAFEGPAVEGHRVLLLFLARSDRVFAQLAMLGPAGTRQVFECTTYWPSQFYGCAIEALLRKLLIDARESPQSTPLLRRAAAQIATPSSDERFLWDASDEELGPSRRAEADMTDEEARALGLKAQASAWWRWLPRMVDVERCFYLDGPGYDGPTWACANSDFVLPLERGWVYAEMIGDTQIAAMAPPDFRDAPTLGGLEALVCEALGEGVHARRVGPTWVVCDEMGNRVDGVSPANHASKAEALVAALVAAPAPSK